MDGPDLEALFRMRLRRLIELRRPGPEKVRETGTRLLDRCTCSTIVDLRHLRRDVRETVVTR